MSTRHNFIHSSQTYRRIISIVYLMYVLIINIQLGCTSESDSPEIKIGVCNYKSKSDPLEDAPQDTILRNVEHYLESIQEAGSQKAKLIVFPEGGLTTLEPFFEKGDAFLKYSLNTSGWKNSCPCDDGHWSEAGKQGEAIYKLSCAAKSHQIHVVVNILEKATKESTNYNIFNTNLVFSDSGRIVVRYRKRIPDTPVSDTVDGSVENRNEFKVNNRKFKTIIGNDIYNESYNFSTEKQLENVSIVWSTASKKKCNEIPAVTLAQIFGKKERNIFISDYGDDEWTSSCIYYNGSLYTSFGETDDKLILVPPDNDSRKYSSKKDLKTNCFMHHVLNNISTEDKIYNFTDSGIQNLSENCNINYNKLPNQQGALHFISNFSTTEHQNLQVSLCGIASNANVSLNSKNITITWKIYDGDQFLPITADHLYWPFDSGVYEYQNISDTVQLTLKEETNFTFFFLMRIRNTNISINCIKNQITTDINDASGSQGTYIVVSVTLGIVVFLIIIMCIVVLYKIHQKCRSAPAESHEQSGPAGEDVPLEKFHRKTPEPLNTWKI